MGVKWLFVVLAYLSVIPIAHASVLFSEISADPDAADEGREWIEFYVTEETNLSGWTLREGGTDHRLSLVLGNETVQPGTHFMVADNAGTFANETGYNGTLFDSAFSLSNKGELLVLKNATYAVNLTYNETGEGQTFCSVGDLWGACEPTPGAANKFVSPSENASENDAGVENSTNQDAENVLAIVAYPKRLRFGSLSHATVFVDSADPLYVYAYGYPKRVLSDFGGKGVTAKQFDGETSVLVIQEGPVVIPLRTKDNCEGAYEDGPYRIRIRATSEDGREIETKDLSMELYGRGDCKEILMEAEEKEEVPIQGQDPKLYIVDAPTNVTVGEPFVIRVVLSGRGAFDVYSYLRDGRTLASLGGWNHNKRTINVDEFAYLELNSTPNRAGNLTLVVRAKQNGKTYDALGSVMVNEPVVVNESGDENTSITMLQEPKEIIRTDRIQKQDLWTSFIQTLRRWL